MTRTIDRCRKVALVAACGGLFAVGVAQAHPMMAAAGEVSVYATSTRAAPQTRRTSQKDGTASATTAGMGVLPGTASGAGLGLIAGLLLWVQRRRQTEAPR